MDFVSPPQSYQEEEHGNNRGREHDVVADEDVVQDLVGQDEEACRECSQAARQNLLQTTNKTDRQTCERIKAPPSPHLIVYREV